MATNPERIHYSKNVMDFWRLYRRHWKKEDREVMGLRQYRKFIKDVFFNIMHTVLNDKAAFILPYSMGYIYVHSRKLHLGEIRPDFEKSMKYKMKVLDFNGKQWRHISYFKWDKQYSVFRNKTYYSLRVLKNSKMGNKAIGRNALWKLIQEVSENPEKSSVVSLHRQT